MKTVQDLSVYLEELKKQKINIDDIDHAEFLSDAEKCWVLEKFRDWDIARLESGTPENIRKQVDPIDVVTRVIRTWGSKEADKKISPIQDHSYIIFAGEQGSGKTAFTFDMAMKNAERGKVVYLSLEMNGVQIISRVARAYAGITKEMWLNKADIDIATRSKYKYKYDKIKQVENFEIIGFEAGESPTIGAVLNKIKEEFPVLAFVDNFDLISKSEINQLNHEREISKKFMEFCHQWNIPIVVIHHTKKTKDKRDIDSIRGSGKITDDADQVIMGTRMDGENITPEERKQFTIIELKDREFGERGIHTFQYDRGTFVDSISGFN